MKEHYENLIDALADLSKDGFTDTMSISENGIYCVESKKTYKIGEIKVVQYYIFESDSDVGDMAILYALKSIDGCKSVIIDAYGTYTSSTLDRYKLFNTDD